MPQDSGNTPPAPKKDRTTPTGNEMRRQIEERIQQLHAKSRKGLWGLLTFIMISLGAIRNFDFIPPLSSGFRDILGRPPSPNLISLALVVYAFSALILILARMTSGSDKYKGWSHLFYLVAFYGFYYLSDALRENFWAVFAAGMTIFSLEYYHMWNRCNEKIREEKENLARLERQSGFE